MLTVHVDAMTLVAASYVIRFLAWRWAFAGICRRYLPDRVQAAVPHIWDMLGNLYIVGWLVHLMTHPDTSGYLHVWQLVPSEHFHQGSQRLGGLDAYLACEAAWYLAGMINSILYRDHEMASMFIHHSVAIALIQACLAMNVTRIGVAVGPFLMFSNPLLHAAKALNRIGHPAKDPMFVLFAIVFFLTRVVAFPAVYLRITLIDVGRSWMLDGRASSIMMYTVNNAMLLCIYTIQLMWFSRIVGILQASARRRLQSR